MSPGLLPQRGSRTVAPPGRQTSNACWASPTTSDPGAATYSKTSAKALGLQRRRRNRLRAELRAVFTLAGLWRLVSHVVRRYVADADKVAPEPWDYRNALPGIVDAQLAPQYWIWQAGDSRRSGAPPIQRLRGGTHRMDRRHHAEGFPLDQVCLEIEGLVPTMPDVRPRPRSSPSTGCGTNGSIRRIAAPRHRVHRRVQGGAGHSVTQPPSLFRCCPTTAPTWSADDWVAMAQARSDARYTGKQAPFPAAIDALIQLEAADQLEAAVRHDEAVAFAANAVAECPATRLCSLGKRASSQATMIPISTYTDSFRRAAR